MGVTPVETPSEQSVGGFFLDNCFLKNIPKIYKSVNFCVNNEILNVVSTITKQRHNHTIINHLRK